MCRSCFLICPAVLCLLIWAFNPIIFKVIIDRHLFIAMLPSLHLCSSLSHYFSSSCSSPFTISFSARFVEVYSFSLLQSKKLLIWPSISTERLAGYSSLGCKPLLFITWNISCHSLLACSISIEKSAASLIWGPLYVISCFSLAAFKVVCF